jgi:hypothetical protein
MWGSESAESTASLITGLQLCSRPFEPHAAQMFTPVLWMTSSPVRAGTRLCTEMHEVGVPTGRVHLVGELPAHSDGHLLGQRTVSARVGRIESGRSDCVYRSSVVGCRRRHDLAGVPPHPGGGEKQVVSSPPGTQDRSLCVDRNPLVPSVRDASLGTTRLRLRMTPPSLTRPRRRESRSVHRRLPRQ